MRLTKETKAPFTKKALLIFIILLIGLRLNVIDIQIINIAGLSLLLIALFFAETQIRLMWKRQREEIIIAIMSLIEEMEYNRGLLEEYLQHCDKGAHLKEKEGKVSYEWNKPRFGAYEKYLILACRNNYGVANKISHLYAKLESCKIIIETIQHLVATNVITVGSRSELHSEMIKHNKQLCSISEEARRLIGGLIKELKSIKSLS